jgi:hypothetical protein
MGEIGTATAGTMLAMESALTSLASALRSPAPWLLPHVPIARRIVSAAGDSHSVTDALNAAAVGIHDFVRFVPQAELPTGESYEVFIARTGSVPTRDNLHDLFNGLMWLSFPKTKQRLNILQAQQIALLGTAGPRGILRDALTVFDENAAILRAPDSLIDALRKRDWYTLFVERRADWQAAQLILFGHALLEKLMQPRKAITGHVWLIGENTTAMDGGSVGNAWRNCQPDETLALSVTSERLSAKDFLPLPVLGVPGWWAANEDPSFYDDAEVFRPRR